MLVQKISFRTEWRSHSGGFSRLQWDDPERSWLCNAVHGQPDMDGSPSRCFLNHVAAVRVDPRVPGFNPLESQAPELISGGWSFQAANSVAKVGGSFRAPEVLFLVTSRQSISPKGNQPLTLRYARINVELQQTCGCATLWRSADQATVIKDKVVCPLLCAWIEEKAKLAGLRVERAEVGALVPVAAPACVRVRRKFSEMTLNGTW